MDGAVLNRMASCGVLATWGAATPDERQGTQRRTRERRSRGSTHGATESVRGHDVRWGSPSRRAQGVSSQRERSFGFTPHAWEARAGRLPRCARRQIVTEAATAKNRGIRRRERQRELSDPPLGNRRRTKMPRCAASAACGVRVDRKIDQGDAYRGSPANKWNYPWGATRATEIPPGF